MAEQNSAANHITGDQASGDTWEGAPSRLMSQEGVFQLTQDLRKFSETLISLKTVFSEERDVMDQSLRVTAHERLGELLKVLKSIVNKYEELNSTGILNAAENLINHIKNFNYESGSVEEAVSPEILSAINNLALAFSSSVSECLIGDINISPRQSMVASQSCENISQAQSGQQRQSQYDSTPEIAPVNSAVTVDAAGPLASSETVTDASNQFTQDLDVCFDRAKAWSKYAYDLIAYVKKKAHIDMEYAKQLTKLSQSTRTVLSEQSYLPFQSLYCTALDNDKEHASKVNTMYQSEILAHKFIEALQSRRVEHDRITKGLREGWRKDKRWLEEAETNLRKAKQQYQYRNQEYLKAKEAATKADQQQFAAAGVTDISHIKQGSGSSQLVQNVVAGSALGIVGSAKVEKKRRQEDDSYAKASQAEQYYRNCVFEANKRRQDLELKEEDYSRKIRDLMTQCDQTTKSVTLSFFQLHCELVSPIRVQYEALLESSKDYEPGSQYTEYLRTTASHHVNQRVNYQFEPYGLEGVPYMEQNYGTAINSASHDEVASSRIQIGYPTAPRRISHKGLSDTESSSSRSLDDISPSASPGDRTNRKHTKRRQSTEGSLSSEDMLDEQKDINEQTRPTLALEKIGPTHSPDNSPAPPLRQMPKMMKIVKDAFKGMKRNPKATIYGVEFAVAAQEAVDGVPFLIKKCIAEIDNRALTVKGIYRVNGVKNRVEKLCAMLDTPHSVRVDLSEQLPHDVSGVLKFFLRQLPEPLLLYKHYDEFLEVAKEYAEINKAIKVQEGDAEENASKMTNDQEQSSPDDEPVDHTAKFSTTLEKMHNIVEKLPEANRNTLQYIVAHLSRVSEHSSSNKMTASNLAIIFGPTLLRPLPQTGNELQSLIDLSSQSQAIEMLITHRNKIFEIYSHKVSSEDIKDTQAKNQVVRDLDELHISNHEQQGSIASQRPKTYTAPTQPSTVILNPPEDVPANVEQVHVSLDSHSTSGTSSSGEIFITGAEDTNQSIKKDSFSSENPQIGQSNGGMNMIDGGRTVISRSPRLTKNPATSDLMRETLGAFLDGRNSVREDISTIEHSPTTANTNFSPRDSKPQSTRPSSLFVGPGTGSGPTSNYEGHSPKTRYTPPSPTSTEQPRSRNPSGEQRVTSSATEDVPVPPYRSKSKRVSSESGKSSAETYHRNRSPSLQSPASPHRPRSKIVGPFRSISQNDTLDVSETVPSIGPSTKKRNSAIANLFPLSTNKGDAKNRAAPTTGRRLPQLPRTKPAASPTRTRPISKPGRTPPFNKTPAWSFAKTDIGELDSSDKRTAGVPKRILLDDDDEEVSLC